MAHDMCHRCCASRVRPGLMFTNFREDAAWTDTAITTAAYLAATPPDKRSPLCNAPGWQIDR
eukprot:2151242-Alexandrium_andersonii.AAC.1